MTRYAMAIDLDRCQGCRACVEACKIENNTPSAVFWMYVFRFEQGEYPSTTDQLPPRPCQHCANPTCARCARWELGSNATTGSCSTDYDRCIGCRYCEVACPYGVNFFNWRHPDEAFDDYQIDFTDPDLESVTGGVIPAYQNPDLALPQGEEQRLTAGSAHHKGCDGEVHLLCAPRRERDVAGLRRHLPRRGRFGSATSRTTRARSRCSSSHVNSSACWRNWAPIRVSSTSEAHRPTPRPERSNDQ